MEKDGGVVEPQLYTRVYVHTYSHVHSHKFKLYTHMNTHTLVYTLTRFRSQSRPVVYISNSIIRKSNIHPKRF